MEAIQLDIPAFTVDLWADHQTCFYRQYPWLCVRSGGEAIRRVPAKTYVTAYQEGLSRGAARKSGAQAAPKSKPVASGKPAAAKKKSTATDKQSASSRKKRQP